MLAETQERLPPHNVEAEEAVLGSVLIDREAIGRLASFLRDVDFYRERNREIYAAALSLYDRREPTDLLTVKDELERQGKLAGVGGAAYLASLSSGVPTAVHAEFYARIVERTAVLRRLIGAAGQIAAIGYAQPDDLDAALDKAEQVLFSVSERRMTREFVPLHVALKEYFDTIDFLHQHKGEVVGVPSGFRDLDQMTGGLHASDLVIIAGRPAVGKTSFVLSIAQNAAVKHQVPVALFSLEMSVEQLVQRLLCSEATVDSQRLRSGFIDEFEWHRISTAFGVLSEAPIYIDDTANITTLELRAKARRMKAEHNIQLLIIDYLQLMQGRGLENRVQEVSEISRGLKGLARELDLPVIALSQLSRAVESRQDHRPVLSDLRESGCLAGDSLVYLPAEGTSRRIDQLVGESSFDVLALSGAAWRLEPHRVQRAFATGRKPVYHLRTGLGREITATANHKFRTIAGWRRLDELRPGADLAVPLVPPGQSHRRQADLSDVYWDKLVGVEPAGEAEVYDLTVEGPHNFVANDIVVHNSIEQDADIVMFIHREEIYKRDTDRKNIADVIVAKHRNGPTGDVALRFFPAQTRFADLERFRQSE
ncbi:MAG: replicative DNA helicase [Chloroflexota bacterium]